MGNMEEQGLACACYVASQWARRALSGSGKVWNRGSLLLRHHLKVSNVKKHLRPLDPYDQNQLLHNEWIVPYYNWSSFCVKRKPPPKAILNQSNRSPLTDICLVKGIASNETGWRVPKCQSDSPDFEPNHFKPSLLFCQASKIASCHVPYVLTHLSIFYDHVCLYDIFGLRKYKRVSSAAIQSPPPHWGSARPT